MLDDFTRPGDSKTSPLIAPALKIDLFSENKYLMPHFEALEELQIPAFSRGNSVLGTKKGFEVLEREISPPSSAQGNDSFELTSPVSLDLELTFDRAPPSPDAFIPAAFGGPSIIRCRKEDKNRQYGSFIHTIQSSSPPSPPSPPPLSPSLPPLSPSISPSLPLSSSSSSSSSSLSSHSHDCPIVSLNPQIKVECSPLSVDRTQGSALSSSSTPTVGVYSKAERQRKIARYRAKRARRNYDKRILYECRKNFADRRPRVGGRFVKIAK